MPLWMREARDPLSGGERMQYGRRLRVVDMEALASLPANLPMKLKAAYLIPWEKNQQGLAVTWSDGTQEAFQIGGPVLLQRPLFRVSPEDGIKILGVVSGAAEWKHCGKYRMKGDRRHVIELPTVVFEWFGAEDIRTKTDERR